MRGKILENNPLTARRIATAKRELAEMENATIPLISDKTPTHLTPEKNKEFLKALHEETGRQINNATWKALYQ